MKKRHLIKCLRQTAKQGGVGLHRLRQGKHEVWLFGNERLIIPRHSDINEFTAAAILHQAQKEADRSAQ